jgi:hypothetical protein
LTLAQGIGCVYKVQLVLNICPLNQLPKPYTLRFGIAGKIEHDRNFDNRAQTCGVSALFTREEHSTNPGMSMISPGNKAFKKSSCTRRTVFSRAAKFLARVDLPAAIFPQKNINFAEFFWRILEKKYHNPSARSR